MKTIAVLSHVNFNSIYGAGTSLRNHYDAFRICNDYQFIHIERRKIIPFGKKEKSSELKLSHYPNVKARFSLPLPFSQNHDGCSNTISIQVKAAIRFLFDDIGAWKTINRVNKIKPDAVHINSLVLLPIVRLLRTQKCLMYTPIIAHVRELLKYNLNRHQQNILTHQINHFICIDKAAYNRLIEVVPSIKRSQISIIQNPFIYSNENPDPIFLENIPKHFKVFAIVGKVSPDKGVDLVCRAFLSHDFSDAMLIIIGDANDSYGKAIRQMCEAYPNRLRWLGEQSDLVYRGFFNGIDVLVRGDKSFRTGRTVYEALFSGVRVILPGSSTELGNDSILNNFAANVDLYEPNSLESLTTTLLQSKFKCTQCRIKNHQARVKRNNYNEYLEQVINVYQSVF